MTIDQITEQITRAYGTHETQYGKGEWMSLRTLAYRVDLTPDQIKAGIAHLARTTDRFVLAPTSNQKMLTAEDHDLAVWIGGQWKHVFSWE